VKGVSRSAIVFLVATVTAAGSLDQVMQEKNLEKRSEVALRYASKEIDAARDFYAADQMEEFRRSVNQVGALAELSYKSLQDTGKRARRSPKWFKRAELSLRSILRRIDGLEKDVSYDDRPVVETVHKRVAGIHEQILLDIMTKK
jgi:hypothetical protein